jgi:hypothetical protein
MTDQKAQDGELCIDETPGLPKQRAFTSRRDGKLTAPVVRLFPCGYAVSLKLTDLVRFASLISLSFCVHSVHPPACGTVALYTCKVQQ